MIDELSLAKEKIRRIGVSTSTVAVIAGMSASEVSQFLNGQRPCSNEKAHRLNLVATRLEDLIRQISPLPLDLKQPLALREVLTRIEQGELQPIVLTTNSVVGETVDKMLEWATAEA